MILTTIDLTVNSAITPLKEVINNLWSRILKAKIDPGKQTEIQADYFQRQKDLGSFLKELENNPLGFLETEIEVLRKQAKILDEELNVIGLLLYYIEHLSEAELSDAVTLYLKKAEISKSAIITELSKIENTAIRHYLLHNKLLIKAIEYYSVEEIQKTVNLINQYFIRTPEEKCSYQGLIQFLVKYNANWIPLQKQMFDKQAASTLPENPADILQRLAEIERTIAAFELEAVPENKINNRLSEIYELKNELAAVSLYQDKTGKLTEKLTQLYNILIPLKPKTLGFFTHTD